MKLKIFIIFSRTPRYRLSRYHSCRAEGANENDILTRVKKIYSTKTSQKLNSPLIKFEIFWRKAHNSVKAPGWKERKKLEIFTEISSYLSEDVMVPLKPFHQNESDALEVVRNISRNSDIKSKKHAVKNELCHAFFFLSPLLTFLRKIYNCIHIFPYNGIFPFFSPGFCGA